NNEEQRPSPENRLANAPVKYKLSIITRHQGIPDPSGVRLSTTSPGPTQFRRSCPGIYSLLCFVGDDGRAADICVNSASMCVAKCIFDASILAAMKTYDCLRSAGLQDIRKHV